MIRFLVDAFYDARFSAGFGYKIPLSKSAIQTVNTDGLAFLFKNELRAILTQRVILTQEARDLIGNAHYRTRVSVKGLRYYRSVQGSFDRKYRKIYDYSYTIQFARKADAAMFMIAFPNE